MAKLKVEVLAPKRLAVGVDSQGKPVYRTFTAEDCKRYVLQGNRMIGDGVAIPSCWGHRDDAKPLSADEATTAFARGTVGFVERYQLDGNRAVAIVDVPDEEDAKRAAIVRYASPEIERFVDGNGKDWGEVVTHLALTPRPRQHQQQPITRLGIDTKKTIRLSIDPKRGTDMADETEMEDTDTGTDSDAGTGDYFAQAMEMLMSIGVKLPDDTTPENAWERIVVACMQGKSDSEPEPEQDDMTPPPGTEEPPMSMPVSLAFKKQQAVAVALATKNIRSEIDELTETGRITPKIGMELNARLAKVRLGFREDGELKRNDLLIEIEAYKRLPKNSSWSRKGERLGMPSGSTVVSDPPDLNDDGEPSEAEMAKILDAHDAICGRSKKS